MRTFLVLIAALLLWTQPVSASCKFSAADWALLGTYSALHFRDWEQTRDIAARSARYEEINPVLGEHPPVSRINLHFTVEIAAIWGLACWLDDPYRKSLLMAGIVVELSLTEHNRAIGLRSSF